MSYFCDEKISETASNGLCNSYWSELWFSSGRLWRLPIFLNYLKKKVCLLLFVMQSMGPAISDEKSVKTSDLPINSALVYSEVSPGSYFAIGSFRNYGRALIARGAKLSYMDKFAFQKLQNGKISRIPKYQSDGQDFLVADIRNQAAAIAPSRPSFLI